MVPIIVYATNTIVTNAAALGRDPDHRFRVSGCWRAHNTTRCAAADDGGAKALPGVEGPGSGSRRVLQRALK